MGSLAPSAWSALIANAAVSALGIAALSGLVVGSVVLALIKPADKPEVRLGVIVLLMLFCGALFAGAIYEARPTTLSSAVAKGAAEAALQSPSLVAGSISGDQASHPASAVVTVPAPAPAPIPVLTLPTQAVARTDCGNSWSGWTEVGGAVGNPCPAGCTRGDELGQSYRVVGILPPRPQTQHNFQCWRQ